jgi:glycosyltransferase involved in cell wall biosynthesis
VHTIGYVYLPSLLATTLGTRTDAGVVVTVDAFPGESWSYGNRFVDSIAKLYTRGFAGRIFEAADAVVGLGEYNKPDFERFVDDQSKVEIIPNGVDTDRYRPEAMPAETGSDRPRTDGSGGVAPRPKPLGGATEDDPVALLYVGRLDTVKGVPYLLEMLAKLRATGRQSYTLTIVGDGSRREACERRCRELGITDCVSFEGWQSEVRPYYQEHDLFVLPSISEGLPTVLTEAQACGIPVVSTDVGGAREQVRAGEVVPCRDADALAAAVERLAGDDLAARGRRAREHVEANYSLSSMGDAYVRLYRRLSENHEHEQ